MPMFGSATVYSGVVLALAGLLLCMKPIRRIRVATRLRAAAMAATGAMVIGLGFLLPAAESRVATEASRLDQFAPVWQFHEVHTRRIAAPPTRVFDALKRVRADEIALFRTLTWIRRGGRAAPPSILNAGDDEPLLDIATKSGFILLADDPPRELVIGTVVVAPPGTRGTLTPEIFLKP